MAGKSDAVITKCTNGQEVRRIGGKVCGVSFAKPDRKGALKD
jgi:hypothetical protein